LTHDPAGAIRFAVISVLILRFPTKHRLQSNFNQRIQARSLAHALSVSSALLLTGVSRAQELGSPELEACKGTGLMGLKERAASVNEIILDAEASATRGCGRSLWARP